MTGNEKIAFVPFHAINEFMRDDFRHKVIHEVYLTLSKLSNNTQKRINLITRKEIDIQGFRDSTKAPPALRVRNAERAFEKSPAFVSYILAGWAELHEDLGHKIFALLTSQGWNPHPVDADRSKLPGFLPDWPEDQDFEQLDNLFAEMYPDNQQGDDDINLMIVWISGKLPYHQHESEG